MASTPSVFLNGHFAGPVDLQPDAVDRRLISSTCGANGRRCMGSRNRVAHRATQGLFHRAGFFAAASNGSVGSSPHECLAQFVCVQNWCRHRSTTTSRQSHLSDVGLTLSSR